MYSPLSFLATLHSPHLGTLSIARATGKYSTIGGQFDPAPGSEIKIIDDNTFEVNLQGKNTYETNSVVFFDDDTATFASSKTHLGRKEMLAATTGTMERMTEEEFVFRINQSNKNYKVPKEVQLESPMTSDVGQS